MDKKGIWDYIQIGTNLRYIQDCGVGTGIFLQDGPKDNIERLLDDFEELGLEVTLRASYELVEFLEKLKEEEKKEEFDKERTFKIEEIENLRNISAQIRHTMTAECRGVFAYITSDKRYDSEKLSNKIEKLFSPDTYSEMPDMAQFDFSEAGKCVVFERSTSAAFHILRGTEVIVRLYYKKYLRKKPDGKTWGQMLNELKNKNRGKKPNSVTVNHLINIKDSFRNPTQHPDKIYDIQEVQDLLSVCIDVVNKMMNELK